MQNFDSSRFTLGTLCRRGHEWNNTGESLRYKKSNTCVQCKLLVREIDNSILPRTKQTHGMSNSPTYSSWKSMLDRCQLKTHASYANYGAKGITVCDRWLKFETFFEDMGERPEGTSLDRIDSKGNYEPGNCRWATPWEQANNRSDNRLLTYKCETMSMNSWARRLGVPMSTLVRRQEKGWTAEQIIETPFKDTSKKEYEHGGKTQSLSEWAKELGVNSEALRGHLRKGRTIAESILMMNLARKKHQIRSHNNERHC